MAYQIDYAYTCHTGKVRANNEDNFWCCGVRLPVNNQGVDGILAGHTQHWQLPVLAALMVWRGELRRDGSFRCSRSTWAVFMKKTARVSERNPWIFLQGPVKI